MKIIKKVLGLSIIILLLGSVTQCTNDGSVGPDELESVGILQSKAAPHAALWLSDYFPSNPHQFGIRTYYWYDEEERFVAFISGTETVPYLSGSIEATKLFIEDEEIGLYVDGRELWLGVTTDDYYVSVDCALTAFPFPVGGKVWDGMFVDLIGLPAFLVKKDGSECIPMPENDRLTLFKIDDVDIFGQKYANALILWSLEPEEYQPLDFGGYEDEWGITLPTSDETRGNAVDGFVIFAFRDGLVALGETSVDDGQLEDLALLVSKAPVVTSSKIAFVSDRDDPLTSEIYVMNADGSGQTRLTNDSDTELRPRWSPNGKRIAFSRQRDGDWDIWMMNADGSGETNLTENPGVDHRPGWSPNGKQIVFRSNRDGNAEIYVMNADGSEVTRLTNDPAFDGAASFSPNGKKIVFMSERDRGDLDIYVMNADGSGVERLTDSPASDGAPRWSPNGKQIAFRSDRDGDNEVWVMNADGSGKRNLTDNENIGDVFPSWSPNGREIAFGRTRDGNTEVYVMNSDGSGIRRLTYSTAFDGEQDWAGGRCKSCR